MTYKLNQLTIDQNGDISGVLGINKPEGLTSHDIVNIARKKLHTKKVGHAGALDPFASGVLPILIGRFTKLSNQFMNHDKDYEAEILLGVQTDTLDTEGKITKTKKISPSEIQIKLNTGALDYLKNGYEQRVPIYSSVKVKGQKLRKLARSSKNYKISGAFVTFFHENESTTKVKIPKKPVVFSKFEIGKLKPYPSRGDSTVKENSEIRKNKSKKTEPDLIFNEPNPILTNSYVISLKITCSKGTYIRQLASDIGDSLNAPAMLIKLKRTRVGKIKLKDCIDLNELESILN